MWALLLLPGCPKRAPDPAEALHAAVAASDRAWEARTTDGLAPVAAPLLEAWSSLPGDPEVGWRLVRLRVAEGATATDSTAARSSFAEGRAQAVACLDAEPLFAQRRTDGGWTVALEALPPDRSACAAWGALAWVRWMEVLGPEAAALDLDVVDALLGAVADAPTVEDPAGWATGVLLAIRPAWAGRDRERAAVLLRRAVDRDPDSVLRRLDLYRATGEPALLEELRSMKPKRPEDVGAWEAFVAVQEVGTDE